MKKLRKHAIGAVTGAVTLGVGASVISGMGGPAAIPGGQMIGNMASGMPAAGAAMGGGMVVSSLGMLVPKKKKRR